MNAAPHAFVRVRRLGSEWIWRHGMAWPPGVLEFVAWQGLGWCMRGQKGCVAVASRLASGMDGASWVCQPMLPPSTAPTVHNLPRARCTRTSSRSSPCPVNPPLPSVHASVRASMPDPVTHARQVETHSGPRSARRAGRQAGRQAGRRPSPLSRHARTAQGASFLLALQPRESRKGRRAAPGEVKAHGRRAGRLRLCAYEPTGVAWRGVAWRGVACLTAEAPHASGDMAVARSETLRLVRCRR